MNEMVPEIVRIGVESARIKCVTPQRVEYLDQTGKECFVDLDKCVRNWGQRAQLESEDVAASEWGSRCVAERGFLDDPPWVEFTNERRTRFEFASLSEALTLKLLLAKVRWRTFDAN